MKLLTITAIIVGIACMAVLYTGNAYAAQVDALGACIAAQKTTNNCGAMTGHDVVRCNFDAWCHCTGACVGTDAACIQTFAAEKGDCNATTGYLGEIGSLVSCSTIIRGGEGVAWKMKITAESDIQGRPAQDPLLCEFNITRADANVEKLMILRDPVTNCNFTEFFDTVDEIEALQTGGTRALWDDVKSPTFEDDVLACIATFGVDVTPHTNLCPVGYVCTGDCNIEMVSNWLCPYVPGTDPRCAFDEFICFDPVDPLQFTCHTEFVCGPLGEDPPERPDPACPYQMVCRDENNVIIPNALGFNHDKFDDVVDYGIDACRYGDFYVDGVLVIDYNDCILEKIKALSLERKKYIAILTGLLGTQQVAIVAELANDGYISDTETPYVLYNANELMNCELERQAENYVAE